MICRLPIPNTEQLWGYLHVVPSKDDPRLESGIGEWNQSFAFQHLSSFIDHDVGEVPRGNLQVLGEHGGSNNDLMSADLLLCGVAEEAPVFSEAAVHLGGGVSQVDGAVSGYNPQGNSPGMPIDHVLVEVLPDVDISSTGKEQKGKL